MAVPALPHYRGGLATLSRLDDPAGVEVFVDALRLIILPSRRKMNLDCQVRTVSMAIALSSCVPGSA